jgi:Bifunctional DNA primase/polymerase, N-terminal/Primase C terminal 2 (PriCT-2)
MSTLDIARAYRDQRGWKVIPLDGKLPVKRNFVERSYTASDFTRPGRNIGVVLGSRSDWLVDIDLDCIEAVELADAYLPVTHSMFGRASKPRSHRLYRSVGATYAQFTDRLITKAEGKHMLLELRSDTGGGVGAARHTAFPGSVHPSGEAVEWDEDGEPRAIDAERLAVACAWLAVGSMILRHCEPGLIDPYHPTLDMPRKVTGACPALIAPVHRLLGLSNPHELRRPPAKRISEDADPAELLAMADNNLDRLTWIKVCAAVWSTMGDGGWDAFLAFSQKSPRHNNFSTVDKTWKSLRGKRTRAGIGTLVLLARGEL